MAKAPVTASVRTLVSDVKADMAELNDAVLRDAQRQDIPAKEMPYTRTPDQGLASRRSKHIVRTHAEVAAATTGEPPLGQGLSFRAAMPGQCENDQFPFGTDRYGKPRS